MTDTRRERERATERERYSLNRTHPSPIALRNTSMADFITTTDSCTATETVHSDYCLRFYVKAEASRNVEHTFLANYPVLSVTVKAFRSLLLCNLTI